MDGESFWHVVLGGDLLAAVGTVLAKANLLRLDVVLFILHADEEVVVGGRTEVIFT